MRRLRRAALVVAALLAVASCGSKAPAAPVNRFDLVDAQSAAQAVSSLPPFTEPVDRARALSTRGVVFDYEGDTAQSSYVFRPRARKGEHPRCFRLLFDSSRGRVDDTTPCPTSRPASIPPTTGSRLSLQPTVRALRTSIEALSGSQRDVAHVRAIVDPVATKHNATSAYLLREGVVAAAIFRERSFDCVLIRVADDVKVWRPATIYPPYGTPGVLNCTPQGAFDRVQQQPPK